MAHLPFVDVVSFVHDCSAGKTSFGGMSDG